MEKIKVLVVECDKEPYTKEIKNTLKEKQKLVDGHIQFYELENDVDLICNEEGKVFSYRMNRIVKNDIICGTFIVTGQRDGDSISLTEAQIKKYKNYFSLKSQSVPLALVKNKFTESCDLLGVDLTDIHLLLDICNIDK